MKKTYKCIFIFLLPAFFLLGCSNPDSAPDVNLEETENENSENNSETNSILGCTDSQANNYNANATEDNGSCTYDIVGCNNPNFVDYDSSVNVFSSCNSLDFLGDILVAGTPSNVFASLDHAVFTPSTNSSISLLLNVNTKEFTAFPAEKYKTFEQMSGFTKILNPYSNELRQKELYKLDNENQKLYMYLVNHEEEIIQDFDLQVLEPMTSYEGVRIDHVFKVDGYLYLYLRYPTDFQEDGEILIRSNNYGNGDWELFSLGLTNFAGSTLLNFSRIIVLDNSEVILVNDHNIDDFSSGSPMSKLNKETGQFENSNLPKSPVELFEGQQIVYSDRYIGGEKKTVFYSYTRINITREFRYHYFDPSLLTWFEIPESDETIGVGISIPRSNGGANLLLGYDFNGQVWLYSPN